MKPKIILVVAAAQTNRVIGKSNNELPWPRIKADMKRFRTITMGRPVIMGRVTFETFPLENGLPKPLPGRQNIVITRNKDYIVPENVWIASSVEEAIQKAKETKPEYICIIGGQQIYDQTIDIADEIFLTKVHLDVEGTTKFPYISEEKFDITGWDKESEEVTFPDSSTQKVEFEFERWTRWI